MDTISPAVVKGAHAGSNVRVVYNEELVAVVSSKDIRYLEMTEPPAKLPGGKVEFQTAEGTMSCVRIGGCACGKPWLKRPSAAEVLAGAPTPA